jgi:hypothetical protein
MVFDFDLLFECLCIFYLADPPYCSRWGTPPWLGEHTYTKIRLDKRGAERAQIYIEMYKGFRSALALIVEVLYSRYVFVRNLYLAHPPNCSGGARHHGLADVCSESGW